MRKLIFPLVLALLQPLGAIAQSGNLQMQSSAFQEMELDPTCEGPNRAITQSVNTGRYIRTYYDVKSDGAEVYAGQTIFTGNRIYSHVVGEAWKEFPRPMLSAVTDAGPILRNCEKLQDGSADGIRSLRYQADWRRGKYVAQIEIWIGLGSGTIIKTIRRYAPETPGPNGIRNLHEKFDYTRDFSIPVIVKDSR